MKKQAFSLIEIVIALGVISFALVAILGMFPVAMKASRESQEETRTAAIAQLVFSQLRSQATTNGSFSWVPDLTNTASNTTIPFKPSTGVATNWAIFDYDGAPYTRIVDGQFSSGNPAQAAQRPKTAYMARITVTAEVPVPGSSRIKLEIVPGLLPPENRPTNTYITYVRNTGL